jgi:hypothetical protein
MCDNPAPTPPSGNGFDLLLKHDRLEKATAPRRANVATAHVRVFHQPCERVAIRRRSGYNAIACLNV